MIILCQEDFKEQINIILLLYGGKGKGKGKGQGKGKGKGKAHPRTGQEGPEGK